MELGIIGMGRMGANIARRLLSRGHRVVVSDRNPDHVRAVVEAGALAAERLGEVVVRLTTPRIIWLMLPAGEATEGTLQQLAGSLSSGDLVIDGGNSFYRDSVRWATQLGARGIRFLDVGVSGGVWGRETGYCLMVGGDEEACRIAEPLFTDLAADHGYLRVGSSGTGHFVKMVHNGIEYGMLQAYAEGFTLLRQAPSSLDVGAIAQVWNHGSVVRSWLLELAGRVFHDDPTLARTKGYVEDSGEGRWVVEEATKLGVPIPSIANALFARFRSRMDETFGDQLIAALRQQFGGHAVRTPQKHRETIHRITEKTTY